MELTWTQREGGVEVVAHLRNSGATTAELRQLCLSFDGLNRWWPSVTPPRALRIAYCGAHSRSHTSRSYVTPLQHDEVIESWWVGAVSGTRGPGLVVGGSKPERFVTRVLVGRDGVKAEIPLEHWMLQPGATLRVDPVWIGASVAAPHAALERFASLLGFAWQTTIRRAPSGWGSWGHWLERIDAGLMREMVHA
ncbi:MAG: hypothetical protein LH616_12760, partial [Ilumatobacteraceae bacterium]|nr:hypothetical protein [Ilumatobacteraceae bacterium]